MIYKQSGLFSLLFLTTIITAQQWPIYNLLFSHNSKGSQLSSSGPVAQNELLFEMVKIGNHAHVVRAIKDGAQIESLNNHGFTALIMAIANKDVPLVNLLLKFGAGVNTQEASGHTPLCIALGFVIWSPEISEIVNILFKQGADVNLATKRGISPLHAAARSKNIQGINALMANGANINAQDFGGTTPLHWSVFSNDINTMRTLLEYGADINLRDGENKTPLDFAEWLGNKEFVDAIIFAGGKRGNDFSKDDQKS